ncbi:sentrin-specific protease 6-like isoform X2 [Mytilus californianus]|uniref:sentrin-specific protease 6-like isoform X2 n=1 Tax=Mytilus californianus TaxID=6549 RepID=UPI002246E133|nr:sentrin-specific protease 6-like isoform X2 [Mytilus californianus]
MSFFLTALQDQENKVDHGWSQANFFSQESPNTATSGTGNQMFTSNTPDSQPIASLDGWSDNSVVVEEVAQDQFVPGQYSTGEYIDGCNSQELIQSYTDASDASQVSVVDYNLLDSGNVQNIANVNSNNIQNIPCAESNNIQNIMGTVSFLTSDGMVVNPGTNLTSELTSEGPVKTFNVTVSADGTLVHLPTDDNNVPASDEYVYLNANNEQTVDSVSSAVTLTTVAGSNATTILAPNTTTALTTNHVTGGSVITQNAMTQSPIKTSDVILIPKMQGGTTSVATLTTETIQAILQQKTPLFSGAQRFKYVTTSQGNSAQAVHQIQHISSCNQSTPLNSAKNQINNVQHSGAPRLTSLLTGSATVQSPQILTNIPMKTAAGSGIKVVAPQKTVLVSRGQTPGSVTMVPRIQTPQTAMVVPNQQKSPVVIPYIVPSRTGQATVCNSTTSSQAVRVIQPSQHIIGNKVFIAPSNSVGNVTNTVQSKTAQNQYVTTLSANNGEIITQNMMNIGGNSKVLSASSAQDILSAISSAQGKLTQTTVSSSPQNVTYTIITSPSTKNNQGTMTNKRGRGSINSRGRGRGQTKAASSRNLGQQYIIVQKDSQGKNVSYVVPNSCETSTQKVRMNAQNQSSDIIDLITSPTKLVNTTESDSTLSEGQVNGSSPNVTPVINKKFVRCKDGGDLIAGTTYMVSGPNGLQKRMVFNGENFVEPSAPEQAPDGSMIGGGRKDKLLKGNATGLNMVRENYTDSDSNSQTLPNGIGRQWKYTDPPSATNLARPPLHPNKGTDSESCQDNSSQSKDSSDVKKEDDNFSKEYVAICKYCGHLSSNLTRCERCSRTFPDDIKLRPVTDSCKPLVDKQKFYSNKISEQASVYGGYTIKHAGHTVKLTQDPIKSGRTVRNSGKQYKLVHTRRINTIPEPVTVTISSDEDEPETNTKSEQITQNSKQEVKNNEPDELSDLVNVIPLKRPASPTFGKGNRIARMENQDGQPVRKVKRQNSGDGMTPIRTVSTKTAVIDTKSGTTEMTEDDEVTGTLDPLALDCRSIRVGSLKGTAVEPVFITTTNISFNMEGEDDFHNLKINSDDVVQCLYGKKCNVIFLLTNIEAGKKVRECLSMKEKVDGKAYFDPGGSVNKDTYITFFMNDQCKLEFKQLRSVLKSYKNSKKREFLMQLDEDDQHKLLLKTAPNISSKTMEIAKQKTLEESNSTEDSTDSRAVTPSNSRAVTPAEDGEERSPSPPRILFSGTVEKLITYPPPPATGGITVTNEDLFCLTDGEFLNDVIIDFYLKYLVHEKLSESDRKRTHVFSSFFFKRLTQRINRSIDPHGDVEMSLSERRHARVKKWTKHVDLFEKDFIIVPINERSHWFLAIICFPGYTEVKTVRYFCRETTAEETPESKGDNSQTDTDESQQPSVGENNNKENQNTEEESSEKSNDVKCKQESPMEEDEEQDNEEPMDTNETETNMDTAETGSNSGVDSQEPRGRLLTEEELKDPEMIKNSKEGIQQPCIMVMDSLAGQSRQRIINSLKDYLQVEWNCKKSQTGSIREKFKGASPKVPQQTNYSDCGVYVLQYVDSFFEDPIFNFSFPMKSLANWFTEERVTRKREEIKELVMTLKERYDNEKQKS